MVRKCFDASAQDILFRDFHYTLATKFVGIILQNLRFLER